MIRSWLYITISFPLAAIAAGSVVGVEMAAYSFLDAITRGAPIQATLAFSVIAGLIATLVFLVGLVFPGGLVWFWLHSIRQTSYPAAAFSGAVGAAVAGIVLTVSPTGPYTLLIVTALAVPGAVAGLTIRWVAYRPITPPRRPPVRPS